MPVEQLLTQMAVKLAELSPAIAVLVYLNLKQDARIKALENITAKLLQDCWAHILREADNADESNNPR